MSLVTEAGYQAGSRYARTALCRSRPRPRATLPPRRGSPRSRLRRRRALPTSAFVLAKIASKTALARVRSFGRAAGTQRSVKPMQDERQRRDAPPVHANAVVLLLMLQENVQNSAGYRLQPRVLRLQHMGRKSSPRPE